MQVSPEIQTLITERAHAQKIRELAKKEGLLVLHEAGVELVKKGITTLEEIKREIG